MKVDEVAGSIGFTGNDQQHTAFMKDSEECESQFGEKRSAFKDFTSDMWQDLYSQEKATAECLREHDVAVPPIPAFETFVERYQSSKPWTSYGFTGSVSADAERSLNAACPQPSL